MKMPGFTAEASLSETRGHYQFAMGQAGMVSQSRGIVPQLKDSDIPGATCGKAPVFGNVICVQCTTGSSPTCKTYVCDQSGNNCKETVRVNRGLVAAPLEVKTNVFRL